MVSEKHISLLWSEAVLFSNVSINISPLCGEEQVLCLQPYDTTLEAKW